ncbi:MAG TPA: protein kinase [Polyangiaceae bacterium]|nr:protein kinase [Polyangiaceae bacterium]
MSTRPSEPPPGSPPEEGDADASSLEITSAMFEAEPSAPADRARSLVGTTISGRYRIHELIATGGMGAVYRGEHIHLRKRLAVKVLHPETENLPELVERFRREALVGAHARHPHVAAATDFGTLDDGSYFLVLEHVKGITLHDALKRGPLPPARAVHIARQLAEALDALHTRGIIHRDVKPHNVMLVNPAEPAAPGAEAPPGSRGPDFVKLIDFGLSTVELDRLPSLEMSVAAPAQPPERLTMTGTVFGTVAYLAPEATLGMDNVDGRADLYALGIILYEMLTGRRPFVGKTPADLITQHVSAQPLPFREAAPGRPIPLALEQIARRLLAKDPADRFQRGNDVVAALDAARTADEFDPSVHTAPTPSVGITPPRPPAPSVPAPPPPRPTAPSVPAAPPPRPTAPSSPAGALRPTPPPPRPPVPSAPATPKVPSVAPPALQAPSVAPPALQGPLGAPVAPKAASVAPPALQAPSGPPPAPKAPSVAPPAPQGASVAPPAPAAPSGATRAAPSSGAIRAAPAASPSDRPTAPGPAVVVPLALPTPPLRPTPASIPASAPSALGAARVPTPPPALSDDSVPALPSMSSPPPALDQSMSDIVIAPPPADALRSVSLALPELGPKPLIEPPPSNRAPDRAPPRPLPRLAYWAALAVPLLGVVAYFALSGGGDPAARPESPPSPAYAPPPSAAPPDVAPRPPAEPDASSTASTSASAPTPAASASPSEADLERLRIQVRTAANKTYDYESGRKALSELASLDPPSLTKTNVSTAAIDVLTGVEESGKPGSAELFELLASEQCAPHGLDLLYDVVHLRGGRKAARRAAELLRNPEVLARGSPALRVTFILREADCAHKEALAQRAVTDGDGRTLYLLKLALGGCGRTQALDKAYNELLNKLLKK